MEPTAPLAPWIKLDPALWFNPNVYEGCSRRPRNTQPRLIVGHWTGGEAGTQRFDDDGMRVYNVLRTRKADNGDPMPLSIHFVIGGDGTIWQMADPLLTQCRHASAVNAFSIGIEVVNRGTPPAMVGRPRSPTTLYSRGRMRDSLAFFPEQLDAWCRLVDLLCAEYGIPKHLPGRLNLSTGNQEPWSERVPQHKLRRFSGVIEHLHASSKKTDAGMQLFWALKRRGYAVTEV